MRNVFYASVAVGALLVGSAAPSHASLMLSLSDGTTSSAVSSNTGLVNFTGGVGNFIFNVTTGVSKPVVGSALQPFIDLNSIDITGSGGGGTLTLKLTDTDFIGSGGAAQFMQSVGGTLSAGGYTVSSFMDCGNTPFAQTTALTSESFSGGSFSGSQGGTITTCSGSYSLTQVAVLTLPGSAIFSGDSSLAIPEPPALALFGAGLLGLGFALRRKYVAAQPESDTTAA